MSEPKRKSVLTGGTHREDLNRYPYRPDKIVSSTADLCDEHVYAEVVESLTTEIAESAAA